MPHASVNIQTNKPSDTFSGVWLSKGADDVHIHDAQIQPGGKGVVLGYNVNQCIEDKASRHAVTIVDGRDISVQHVDPTTHKVTTKTITADEFYAKFLAFLEGL